MTNRVTNILVVQVIEILLQLRAEITGVLLLWKVVQELIFRLGILLVSVPVSFLDFAVSEAPKRAQRLN